MPDDCQRYLYRVQKSLHKNSSRSWASPGLCLLSGAKNTSNPGQKTTRLEATKTKEKELIMCLTRESKTVVLKKDLVAWKVYRLSLEGSLSSIHSSYPIRENGSADADKDFASRRGYQFFLTQKEAIAFIKTFDYEEGPLVSRKILLKKGTKIIKGIINTIPAKGQVGYRANKIYGFTTRRANGGFFKPKFSKNFTTTSCTASHCKTPSLASSSLLFCGPQKRR